MKVVLNVEELESRLTPSSVCNANPTYQAECAYLDGLITPSSITDTAVTSGNWSDPATWSNGVPVAGATVWIPNGATVTVDGLETAPLRAILDNGVLTFAPNVNTSLLVNTLIVGTDNNPSGLPEGELDIGTQANPIQTGVTAQLLFADSQSVAAGQTQAQLFPNDPDQLSGGLISMGTLNLVGSTVTPYLNMQSAAAGATTLTLASVPVGWKVGDTLLIPGTDPSRTQSEQIAIRALKGATVTLAAPLQYAHAAPNGYFVQVADENRTVVLADQGTTTQYTDGSDAHVMQMHNDAAYIAYAAFLDPGRTDKSVPEGSPLANGTLNVAGRYSFHFHECYWPTISASDPPIQVVGCFQQGGVGWGYVNHRSNVDFLNDVAEGDFGAAFADQAGQELGAFQNCLAVDVTGVSLHKSTPAGRNYLGDWGFSGQGFWIASPGTALIGNQVWDAQIGYDYEDHTLGAQGLKGYNSVWWTHVPLQILPLATFANNTAGEVFEGLGLDWRMNPKGRYDTYSNFAAWGVTGNGVKTTSYVFGADFEGLYLQAAPGQGSHGISTEQSSETGYTVNNALVTGFAQGFTINCQGLVSVNGGYWDNLDNFVIPNAHAWRQVIFSGTIAFGPHSLLDYDLVPAKVPGFLFNLGMNSANALFSPDRILLPNGQQLYFPNQAASYVPFPGGKHNPILPALIGLTNAQLAQEYGGLLVGGAVASTDAAPAAGTNGLVGTPLTPTPSYRFVGSTSYKAGTSHLLQWQLVQPDGTTSPPTNFTSPTVLKLGWQVVTQIINGQPHSWLMQGR